MSLEAEYLLGSLTRQRDHVFGILEGLSEEQLTTPLLPSGWSCASLVHHLALDVEHYWFRCIVAGESLDFFPETPDDHSGAWRLEPGQSAHSVLALYQDEIERADAIITTTSLDAAPAQLDPWWGEWDVPSLRFILFHVVAETACHAGHLDAARELIDGRQWVVL
jgi:uncharacterized damage-inducible protein DinB